MLDIVHDECMEAVPYIDEVFIKDQVVEQQARILVVELLTKLREHEHVNQLIAYRAIRGYCDDIASRHGGVVPIGDLHQLLDDVIEGKK